MKWQTAIMPGKHKVVNKDTLMGAIFEVLEQTEASIRAKLEHSFWVIIGRFDYLKARYREPTKNPADLVTLFALSNLWMV